MVDIKYLPKNVKVGGMIFEELAFEYFEKKYHVSKKDILALADVKKKLAETNKDIENTIPTSILRTSKLSSLEAIVKFLRENRNMSYKNIGAALFRQHKTLAVTYNVAKLKNSAPFSKTVEEDNIRIPFAAFDTGLSILESICVYLKSRNNSYIDVARIIGKDQRTVWTVCHRAKKKLEKKNSDNNSKNDMKNTTKNNIQNDE